MALIAFDIKSGDTALTVIIPTYPHPDLLWMFEASELVAGNLCNVHGSLCLS